MEQESLDVPLGPSIPAHVRLLLEAPVEYARHNEDAIVGLLYSGNDVTINQPRARRPWGRRRKKKLGILPD
mgnify:CR=1 FL=1